MIGNALLECNFPSMGNYLRPSNDASSRITRIEQPYCVQDYGVSSVGSVIEVAEDNGFLRMFIRDQTTGEEFNFRADGGFLYLECTGSYFDVSVGKIVSTLILSGWFV